MDIAVACWFWLLRNCAETVWFHCISCQCDNEPDEAILLHFKFLLKQLQVEVCLSKLHKDESDVLSMLLKQIHADNDVI